MKTIVLGTGIAGYGAYLACKDLGMLDEVIFYNYGTKISNKEIKVSFLPSIKFPVKKEFGENYQGEKIENSSFKIRYSDSQGGLSDFWSGSVSAFSNEELEERKLTFLKEYYKIIADKIDIMGPSNGQSQFCEEYRISENFESIAPLKCFDAAQYKEDKFSLFCENNKVLISSSCVMCGNCFNGCEYNVVFRPTKHYEGAKILTSKIDHIYRQDNRWNLLDAMGNIVDVCDTLFLACGTFQTIKLLNNSNLLDRKKLEIYDSNAIIFLVKLKALAMRYVKNYGYANKIITIKGKAEKRFNSQVSIIPFNSFFTESIFGSILGKLFNGILLNNFALGMFFSSAEDSNVYKIDSKNKVSVLSNRSNFAKNTLHEIADNLNASKNDFKILKIFKSADSSIHYASNLLESDGDFFHRAEYLKGLHIIDGNLFPGRPAANGNSLSIMAGSYAVVKNYFANLV